MTRNPLINALAAVLYIAAVVSLLYWGPKLVEPKEETVLIPMAMLSLFVFSAAVMGYIFLSKPLQMFLGGERDQAVSLFLKTVGIFGFVAALVFVSALLI